MKFSTCNLIALLLAIFHYSICFSQDWEPQAMGSLPTNYGVSGISVVDQNIVWAVAFDQSIDTEIPADHIIKVLRTTDGGNHWKTFDVEEARGRISFDIVAMDSTTAFITTQDFNSGIGRGIFKTKNGGSTWTEKLKSAAGGVWIRFFDRNEGIAINRHLMAKTLDGGESWDLLPDAVIPTFHDNEYTPIASGTNSCVVKGNHIWFGTSEGRIYHSDTRGSHWEVHQTSLGERALITSVAFSDASNGLATDSNKPYNKFSITHDGGKTWNDITSVPNVSIGNIAHVPGTDSLIIATSDGFIRPQDRISAYSNDFGQNWTVNSEGMAFGGTEFIAPGIGWTSIQSFATGENAAMLKWVDQQLVGIDQQNRTDKITIHPNPTKDFLKIDDGSGTTFTYRIFMANGTEIEHGIVRSDSESINLEAFKNGIYFLAMTTEDGLVITRKIIKAN